MKFNILFNFSSCPAGTLDISYPYGFTIGRHDGIVDRYLQATNHDKFNIFYKLNLSLKIFNMSVQKFELYQFSAVDIFLELLKRRICYYTKKVQQSENRTAIMGPNEKFSFRMIRSKLRKREESSGVHRSNVVHPEGVLQATVVGGAAAEPTQDLGKTSPLEDIFIAPVSNRTSSTYSESYQSTDTTQSLPMFLYSTNSRNSLNSGNDQVSSI